MINNQIINKKFRIRWLWSTKLQILCCFLLHKICLERVFLLFFCINYTLFYAVYYLIRIFYNTSRKHKNNQIWIPEICVKHSNIGYMLWVKTKDCQHCISQSLKNAYLIQSLKKINVQFKYFHNLNSFRTCARNKNHIKLQSYTNIAILFIRFS